METIDLYDAEVAEIGKVWAALQQKWSTRSNSRKNLEEFAKDAHASFLKIGFIVDVKWLNNLVVDPRTQEPFPIEIEVQGRVSDSRFSNVEDGFQVLDHERKKLEVITSRERGEDFAGQKETNTI